MDFDLFKSVINKCKRLFIVLKYSKASNSFKVLQLVSPTVRVNIQGRATKIFILNKMETKSKCFLSSNNFDTMDMTQGQMCDLNLQVHKNAKLIDNAFSDGLGQYWRWGDLYNL